VSDQSLYERIGSDRIRQAITEFYLRAFDDGIIGHFFFGKDREEITKKQISFAERMLGGPNPYVGKALIPVHAVFDIRPPHFGRRQVLMKQTALEVGIPMELVHEWMRLEEQLRSLVIRN